MINEKLYFLIKYACNDLNYEALKYSLSTKSKFHKNADFIAEVQKKAIYYQIKSGDLRDFFLLKTSKEFTPFNVIRFKMNLKNLRYKKEDIKYIYSILNTLIDNTSLKKVLDQRTKETYKDRPYKSDKFSLTADINAFNKDELRFLHEHNLLSRIVPYSEKEKLSALLEYENYQQFDFIFSIYHETISEQDLISIILDKARTEDYPEIWSKLIENSSENLKLTLQKVCENINRKEIEIVLLKKINYFSDILYKMKMSSVDHKIDNDMNYFLKGLSALQKKTLLNSSTLQAKEKQKTKRI